MLVSPEAIKPKEQLDYNYYDQEKRNYNDTITWMAEVLDGQMRSKFDYVYNGHDIIADDNSPLAPVFTNAIDDARGKAAQDPRYNFELRRRQIELEEYRDILKMAKGEANYNTMVVVSDFPKEAYGLGQDFGGYNVKRRQTMLRLITKNPDDSITMTTQSLDGSDRHALENIYRHLGTEAGPGELLGQRIYLNEPEQIQGKLTDELTSVYDSSLSLTKGGQWYAGREDSDRRDTLQFAVRQTDLVNAFLLGPMDERAKYDLSAAITARFENRQDNKTAFYRSDSLQQNIMLAVIEMQAEGQRAMNNGRSFSGCGATIGVTAEGQMSSLGYGDTNKKDDDGDQYGSLNFKCKHGHHNTRPRGKLIPNCQTCNVSVKC